MHNIREYKNNQLESERKEKKTNLSSIFSLKSFPFLQFLWVPAFPSDNTVPLLLKTNRIHFRNSFQCYWIKNTTFFSQRIRATIVRQWIRRLEENHFSSLGGCQRLTRIHPTVSLFMTNNWGYITNSILLSVSETRGRDWSKKILKTKWNNVVVMHQVLLLAVLLCLIPKGKL